VKFQVAAQVKLTDVSFDIRFGDTEKLTLPKPKAKDIIFNILLIISGQSIRRIFPFNFSVE